jgi:hypothetical protein
VADLPEVPPKRPVRQAARDEELTGTRSSARGWLTVEDPIVAALLRAGSSVASAPSGMTAIGLPVDLVEAVGAP